MKQTRNTTLYVQYGVGSLPTGSIWKIIRKKSAACSFTAARPSGRGQDGESTQLRRSVGESPRALERARARGCRALQALRQELWMGLTEASRAAPICEQKDVAESRPLMRPKNRASSKKLSPSPKSGASTLQVVQRLSGGELLEAGRAGHTLRCFVAPSQGTPRRDGHAPSPDMHALVTDLVPVNEVALHP